jgi:hypothetical protein
MSLLKRWFLGGWYHRRLIANQESKYDNTILKTCLLYFILFSKLLDDTNNRLEPTTADFTWRHTRWSAYLHSYSQSVTSRYNRRFNCYRNVSFMRHDAFVFTVQLLMRTSPVIRNRNSHFGSAHVYSASCVKIRLKISNFNKMNKKLNPLSNVFWHNTNVPDKECTKCRSYDHCHIIVCCKKL